MVENFKTICRTNEDQAIWVLCNQRYDISENISEFVRYFILDPLTEIGRLDVGSIVNASNVSRTNMVALIGGGERPKFSQNTLVVYDAAASEPVMDITFGSPLRKVVTERSALLTPPTLQSPTLSL